LALGKKNIIVKNATAYTWDWYYHLVVDRASLKPVVLMWQYQKLVQANTGKFS